VSRPTQDSPGLSLVVLALILTACDSTTQAPVAESEAIATPVLLFAASREDAINGVGVTPIGPELTAAGFKVVSFDLPCHGSDATDEPPLNCWATRVSHGDPVFPDFCAKVSQAITEMNVASIAAVGISRGGYIAIRCAVLDSRITALGLIAPVTDLRRLEEFAAVTVDPAVYGVMQYRALLSARPTLLRMNKTDPRVGTDSALAFVGGFTYLTAQLLGGTGHGIVEGTETAEWLKMVEGR
jgi:alpha-beta hydrolase superfamily lysophospholipase